MHVTPLLSFIDQHFALIGLFGSNAYFCPNGIYFATEEGDNYAFELPEDLALEVAETYRTPGQVSWLLDRIEFVEGHGRKLNQAAQKLL